LKFRSIARPRLHALRIRLVRSDFEGQCESLAFGPRPTGSSVQARQRRRLDLSRAEQYAAPPRSTQLSNSSWLGLRVAAAPSLQDVLAPEMPIPLEHSDL